MTSSELYMSRALMRLYRRWVEDGRPEGIPETEKQPEEPEKREED